jgi:hypothetical protein
MFVPSYLFAAVISFFSKFSKLSSQNSLFSLGATTFSITTLSTTTLSIMTIVAFAECTNRLLVNFKSSLSLKIIYHVLKTTTKYKGIYNLLQTNLQASRLLKHVCTDTKLLKMPGSLILGLN